MGRRRLRSVDLRHDGAMWKMIFLSVEPVRWEVSMNAWSTDFVGAPRKSWVQCGREPDGSLPAGFSLFCPGAEPPGTPAIGAWGWRKRLLGLPSDSVRGGSVVGPGDLLISEAVRGSSGCCGCPPCGYLRAVGEVVERVVVGLVRLARVLSLTLSV